MRPSFRVLFHVATHKWASNHCFTQGTILRRPTGCDAPPPLSGRSKHLSVDLWMIWTERKYSITLRKKNSKDYCYTRPKNLSGPGKKFSGHTFFKYQPKSWHLSCLRSAKRDRIDWASRSRLASKFWATLIQILRHPAKESCYKRL